jgi:hypothetical protein
MLDADVDEGAEVHHIAQIRIAMALPLRSLFLFCLLIRLPTLNELPSPRQIGQRLLAALDIQSILWYNSQSRCVTYDEVV